MTGQSNDKRPPCNGATAPVIDIEGLHKSFGPDEVLRGIDILARPGEVVAMIGGSGSGKSTTLRCINLLEAPSAVRKFAVLRENVALHAGRGGDLMVSDKRHLRQLRSRLAMVFQGFNLWPHMTLEQNVMEAQVQVLGRSKTEARQTARALLDRVGLSARRDVYPAYLSGGQQQRGAIARALAVDPEVMLFDEPTSALDPELVEEVLSVIRDLASEGRTMILVTHEMRFAADVADRVMFLNKGLVEEEGPASDIFRAPKSARLQQFIKTVT